MGKCCLGRAQTAVSATQPAGWGLNDPSKVPLGWRLQRAAQARAAAAPDQVPEKAPAAILISAKFWIVAKGGARQVLRVDGPAAAEPE